MTSTGTARRRTPGRRRIVLGVLAVAVAGAGGTAYAMTRGSGPSYRLATAGTTSLQQTVTTSGTVATMNQASVSFPVRGEVAAVTVALGDTVKSGQTLATLDRTSLDDALHSAQDVAASARQTLASDEAAQTGTSGSSVSANSATEQLLTAPSNAATPSSAPTRSSESGGSTSALVKAVVAAQQKVIADQHRVDLDADIAAADKAVVAEQASCQALLAETPAPSPTDSTAPGSATSDDLTACQDAITAVQGAQKQVQSDEDALAADEDALNNAVSALITALQNTPPSTPSGSGTGSSHGGSASGAGGSGRPSGSSVPQGGASSVGSGGSAQSGSGSANRTITAEQLAADEKAIDAADADVTVAKQNRASATLRTPLAGTVAAVGITTGQSVSAGSTSAIITVLGPGHKSVSTTIGIANVDLVKVGTTATVTVDGVAKSLSGTVTYVGSLNTSGTSGSTATYPVTVVLSGPSTGFYDGAGAAVALHVGTARNVLTVPTSAVHRAGVLATVSVYSAGKVTTSWVTLGVHDIDRTQIVSGLHAGQRVVLATVSAPVPTSSNQNAGRRFGAGQLGTLTGGDGGFGKGP